jgi:tetratricopeptide (TPR) repeat protein
MSKSSKAKTKAMPTRQTTTGFGAKFWISLAVFQVLFALVIFAITREYYSDDAGNNIVATTLPREPAFEWVERLPNANSALLESLQLAAPAVKDPVELSRLADQFFVNKQYALAADMYEQLLEFDRSNVVTYNNLGLTLHYLGRSTEALGRLNEGVAADATNQRIWLTLGFVNGQLGNVGEARTALTTALDMGADTQVGKSAAKMLENLP